MKSLVKITQVISRRVGAHITSVSKDYDIPYRKSPNLNIFTNGYPGIFSGH